MALNPLHNVLGALRSARADVHARYTLRPIAALYPARSFTTLYKYASPHWADELAAGRSVKVGTLGEFRRAYPNDEDRRDVDEGVRRFLLGAGTYTDENLIPEVRGAIRTGRGGGLIIAPDAAGLFEVETGIPDCYTYSVTERFDASVMRAFGGACVRINDPLGFFIAIDAQLRRCSIELTTGQRVPLVADGFVDRCYYATRTLPHDRSATVGIPGPAFHKPPHLQHQQEVRGAWFAVGSPLVPVPPFACPLIAQHCKRWR